MVHRQDKFFSPKRVPEIITLTFDFVNVLATGETISSSVWSIEIVDGLDANPDNFLFGTAAINGTKVSHFVQSGVDGVFYRVICEIETGVGQTIHGTGLIGVDNTAP